MHTLASVSSCGLTRRNSGSVSTKQWTASCSQSTMSQARASFSRTRQSNALMLWPTTTTGRSPRKSRNRFKASLMPTDSAGLPCAFLLYGQDETAESVVVSSLSGYLLDVSLFRSEKRRKRKVSLPKGRRRGGGGGGKRDRQT